MERKGIDGVFVCRCVFVCIHEQGQYMALSSRALTTERGIGGRRQSGPGLKV